MWNWLVSILAALGVYCILTAQFPGIYGPARAALRKRAPKPLTQSQVLQNTLAQKIAPLLQIDPIRREQLKSLLVNLGHPETPELFQAHAMAEGLTMTILSCPLLLVSVPLGAAAMVLIGYAFYARKSKRLERELKMKREAIERELPQFASTIRQSLNSTRDVVAIFSSYRRVCGPALRGEIDRTLNDMMTGNAERAIKALESRVASPKLGQLTRGLVAVLRGDDQRVYFDILAEEYRKAQDEEVEKALLLRPKQLYPYMAALGICFALMLAASLGQDVFGKIQIFFN